MFHELRNTNNTAAIAIDDGALKLFGSCAEVPVKSMTAERGCMIHTDATLTAPPFSNGGVRSILQRADDATHGCFAIVLDVLGVGLHDVDTELAHHAVSQFLLTP